MLEVPAPHLDRSGSWRGAEELQGREGYRAQDRELTEVLHEGLHEVLHEGLHAGLHAGLDAALVEPLVEALDPIFDPMAAGTAGLAQSVRLLAHASFADPVRPWA